MYRQGFITVHLPFSSFITTQLQTHWIHNRSIARYDKWPPLEERMVLLHESHFTTVTGNNQSLANCGLQEAMGQAQFSIKCVQWCNGDWWLKSVHGGHHGKSARRYLMTQMMTPQNKSRTTYHVYVLSLSLMDLATYSLLGEKCHTKVSNKPKAYFSRWWN